MSQFNWQQDAEDQWEETVIYTPEPKPGPKRRRWWLIPVILLALVVAGWLVYRQATRRVAETTTAVTRDLLSSHNLLLQAAYNKDIDLFMTLLSGRDVQWTTAQEAMLPAGTVLNRPSFGLYATFAREPDLTTTENRLISLDFSPDFLSAELVLSQAYSYTLPDGHHQTTTLQQTAVYRQGSQRWLYAPPEADFWGSTLNHERDQLIVVYPERDEEIAQRLAVDLEQTLNQLCRILEGINCPGGMSVTLVLSPDPETFVNLAHSPSLWESGLRIELPTPTLVGLPVDEAGYQALARGYSTQMATAVISHLVGWECCDGAPFYQALLDYQLSQLSLRAWPVTQADYQRVRDEEISLNRIVPYWRNNGLEAVDPADQWLIYTVADFLLQSSSFNAPATAQRSLNEWLSPLPWLETFTLAQADATTGASTLLNKWFATATIFSQVNTEPAPVTLPDQDLQLICSSNSRFERESATLYRYQLATDQWTAELIQDDIPIMSPLPDDSAVVLQNFSEELISTVVWQDGQRSLIINPDETPLFTFGHIYPTGQLLGYRVDQQSGGGAVMPQLIELDGCENDQCVMEDKPGLLAWSPDGRQTIVADPFFLFFNSLSVNGRRFLFNNRLTDQGPYTLYRTDGNERIPIGIGYEPFWIDNETYGYLRPSATGSMDIVIASTADDVPYILITRHTLRFSLSDDPNFAPDFTANYVQVDPHNSERLFVVATSGQGISPRDAYIFSVDWPSRRFSLLLTEGYVGPHVLDFSPDGHWLISSSRQETVGGEAASLNGIRLYNLAQHRDQSFVTVSPNLFPAYLHDWSADGQWLAMLADYDKIALALPGSDYYQLIQHDHGSCLSLAWINRQE